MISRVRQHTARNHHSSCLPALNVSYGALNSHQTARYTVTCLVVRRTTAQTASIVSRSVKRATTEIAMSIARAAGEAMVSKVIRLLKALFLLLLWMWLQTKCPTLQVIVHWNYQVRMFEKKPLSRTAMARKIFQRYTLKRFQPANNDQPLILKIQVKE